MYIYGCVYQKLIIHLTWTQMMHRLLTYSKLNTHDLRLLTQIKHSGDEAPADDELAALEHLLQPLLALLAQFAHDFAQI